MLALLCACVCVRERERERHTHTHREGGREGGGGDREYEEGRESQRWGERERVRKNLFVSNIFRCKVCKTCGMHMMMLGGRREAVLWVAQRMRVCAMCMQETSTDR